MKEDELFKAHIIQLIKEHKQHCNKPCNISTFWLLLYLQNNRYTFTAEENIFI
jgi:hypothetical protein